MSNNFKTILVEISDGAVWLTLNRPEFLNATNEKMFSEISLVLEQIRADHSLKTLIITGSGEIFCIGSDLEFLRSAFKSDSLALFRDYLKRINEVFFAIENLPVPTIAMVNGKARAGGFEMLLACDMVMVANESLIGDVHTPFGHMPGAGATQRLSRKIGFQRALELICTGKWLSGKESVDYGIALRSVPRIDLRSQTDDLVRQLTDKPRDSLTFIKRAMLRGWDLPLQDGIALEVQSYLEYLATSSEPIDIFNKNQEAK